MANKKQAKIKAMGDQKLVAEIEKLTEEIEQEPKAIPGGSPRKARRRGLKGKVYFFV